MSYLNSVTKNLKTKSIAVVTTGILGLSSLMFISPLIAKAAVCVPTGFYRDSINLTAPAADINPTSPVTGTVNATGCNIGVFFGPGMNGSVKNATIYGSNYYGVVVQKAKVNVTDSNIYNIGETPLNGDQHGVAIYYATVAGLANGDCTTGTTKGIIEGNSLTNYQKGGIAAVCTGTNVTIDNNIVQGQGPVNYIAQNGIEVGEGATATVIGNIVDDNSYTGANEASSGGILVFGGACYDGTYSTDIQISNNTVVGNDVGVWLSNLDVSCNPASTRTNDVVTDNTVANAGLNNTTGNGPTQGYQAGVSDQGDHDTIANNNISGAGYNPANSSPAIFTTWIDVSATNNVNLHNHGFYSGYSFGFGRFW